MISPKLRLIREHNRVYRYLLKWLWRVQGKDSPRVYMFHSVVDSPEHVYSQFVITRNSFERFIEYELSRGQIPMDADILKKAVDYPSAYNNHFIVTFDDIYDSVYTNAYPILKAHNVPFIIFVTPSLIDTIDANPKSNNPMITSEHLHEMTSDPLCILGAHATHHVVFRTLNETQARNSMMESKQWLENTFGKKVDFFAFPFGRQVEVSNANIRTLSQCDFCCGFSALDGSLRQKWMSGRWFLPRILVDDEYVAKAWTNKGNRA